MHLGYPTLLALVAFGSAPVGAQAGPEYTVTVRRGSPLVDVVLTLPTGAQRLTMDSIQASHLPKGWATHLRQIVAERGGRPVMLVDDGQAAWRVPDGRGSPMVVRYAVDYSFASEPWPVGNEQAAAVIGDVLYSVGKALFVESDAPGVRTVRFELPPGWRSSVPWDPVPGTTETYRVSDATTLVRNTVVLGDHPSVRLSHGPLLLELALPGAPDSAVNRVRDALTSVLHEAVRLFPDTTRSRYLMTYFRSFADDGEGFDLGGTFTTTAPITTDGIPIWGNFLAHELLHFWNGRRLRGTGPRTDWRWFAEGFTEYYANVLLARTGVFSQEILDWKIERHVANYLYFMSSPAFDGITLEQAGTQTGTYRFGVYDGGWMVALCLDGAIREGSGDTRSLDDMMRTLWNLHLQEQVTYDVALIDSLAAALGQVPDEFVARHVGTRDILPVSECLERFGYTAATKPYAAEVFLRRLATGPGAERRRAAMGSR